MKSVIKGAGYILVHTPDMVIHNGTTQTTERIVNPESEYLKELPGHIRSFEDVLSYYGHLMEHLRWKNLGHVLAGGNGAVGDIQGKPEIQKAYALGNSIQ